MQFKDIIGLNSEKQVLINSVKNNHIAHTQLFYGNQGTGVLPLALAYAQYINCEKKQDDDSCGTCPSCAKMTKFIHADEHFIFPNASTESKAGEEKSVNAVAKWRELLLQNKYCNFEDWKNIMEIVDKQAIISVKESREILRKISLKSFEAEYKIVIIWMPELMNSSAANALLKLLEEPPLKTLFLLVSYDIENLLPTVISRTQKFQVRPFNAQEMEEALYAENADKERIAQAIQFSGGSLNTAFKFINDTENNLFEFFKNWMRACFQKNVESILKMSADFEALGKEAQKNLLEYGINTLRSANLVLAGSQQMLKLKSEEEDFVLKFSTLLNSEKVETFYQIFNANHYNLIRNANSKLVFTNMTFQMIKHI